MTGIRIVDVICPNLDENKKVMQTMNNERWFKVIKNTLYIPTDNVLRANFNLLDKLGEAVNNFNDGAPEQGWWDDKKVNGVTYFEADECMAAIDFLKTQKVLAVDIETRNVRFDDNKVLLIGFAYSDYESVVIRNFEMDVLANLQLLFLKEDITFIWQNGKFDTVKLKYLLGIDARVDEDTMMMHYIGINERKGTHGLKDMAVLYLQAPPWDDELQEYKKKWCLQNKVKLADFQYDMIPQDILIPYLYRDTCATYQLYNKFKNLMRTDSIEMYYRIIKAVNVFRDIELWGCLIDVDYLYKLEDDLDTLIVDAERHVKEEARRTWDPVAYAQDTDARTYPKEFNHKSPKQLKWILEKVTNRKLDTTNKEKLEQLIEEFPEIPFIQAIGELRKYSKYMDTYVQGIKNVICVDNRVRCTFNLHGTETGRLSCKEPNMQNIPRSAMIKNIFKAPENYKLIQLDYSQAELRVLAYLSQDEYLRQTYRSGQDLHDAMALKMFGPNFNKEQRVAAKTVNFGIPYGRGPASMKAKLNMSLQKAADTIRGWFKAAPGAKKYVDEMREAPFKYAEPYTTIFGRQRHYIVTNSNRNHVSNESVNFPISSIASDLTLLAVCEIHDHLLMGNIDARIVNTVHDSIIIECVDDPKTLKYVIDLGREVMQSLPTKYLTDPVLDFPFVADAEIGITWGDLKDVTEVFGE